MLIRAARIPARILVCSILLVVLIVVLLARNFETRVSPVNEGHEPKRKGIHLGIPYGADANAASGVKKLADLKFREDGLVEVNDDGPHPIYQLISQGEKAWEEKVRRQSKTLEEAVIEYRRRYHREPPSGFDRWWTYVRRHKVPLPDEYDSIHHDLQPFWALEPKRLGEIQKELEQRQNSFTLGQNIRGRFSVLTSAIKKTSHPGKILSRSGPVLQILREIAHELPPIRATFNPQDEPEQLPDYDAYQALLQAADSGKQIEDKVLPHNSSATGWVSACSPVLNVSINWNTYKPLPRGRETFIHNHPASMSPCTHPQLFYQHGLFITLETGPPPPPPERAKFGPIFSTCSTSLHHDIRFPSSYGWQWENPLTTNWNNPVWESKTDERVNWRGSNTGTSPKVRKTDKWRHSHRHAMVAMANSMEGTTSVLGLSRNANEKVGTERKKVKNAELNTAFFDIAFGGGVTQCGDCMEVWTEYRWTERQSARQEGKYKYVLDMDGNAWSGRFRRLLSSTSLAFKATIFHEWFEDRIQPWVHYVPVRLDLSDLHDAHIFFRGDESGRGAHDNLARKIALAGRSWAKTHWRHEDLVAYAFRLFLEYGRVMSMDRDSMNYDASAPYIEPQPDRCFFGVFCFTWV